MPCNGAMVQWCAVMANTVESGSIWSVSTLLLRRAKVVLQELPALTQHFCHYVCRVPHRAITCVMHPVHILRDIYFLSSLTSCGPLGPVLASYNYIYMLYTILVYYECIWVKGHT